MVNRMFKKSGMVYVLIFIAAVVIFLTIVPAMNSSTEIPFTGRASVISMAKSGDIDSIDVEGLKLTIISKSDRKFTSRIGEGTDVLEVLREEQISYSGANGVQVNFKGSGGFSLGILLNFLPLIFFGGLIFFMMRQAQGNSSQTLNFGKSKAKMIVTDRPNVGFADVAGADEAKEELQEVVDFLQKPERFLALGARIPRGVLLVGPPGTGKTLLARAVAGEAVVPFFPISGSEFVEMFVGVGASRVRDLFDKAKRNAPCIVFVDEIDAVGRHRGAGLGGGHDEREQTLNQILVEMDGFDSNTNVIVIAATNRPDILDPALLRPGRFDRRVVLDLPDIVGREEVLKVHSKGKPFSDEVKFDVISKETPGFSGADLANLVNEAALLSARRNKKSIGVLELEEAIDRVIAGPERKSRIISPREKAMTAHHEAGHALVAWHLPNADKVHKISIVARGNMGGYTRLLPQEERHLWTKSQFEDMLATALGGRVAEQVIFNEITTGASNDIEVATSIALKMIKRYGMSANLGLRTLGKRQELIFLGKEISEERDYGDKVAEEIDREVQSLIGTAQKRAIEIIETHRSQLEFVAAYLIENESVEGEALQVLFAGKVPVSVKAEELIPEETTVSVPTRLEPKPTSGLASHQPKGPVVDGGVLSDTD